MNCNLFSWPCCNLNCWLMLFNREEKANTSELKQFRMHSHEFADTWDLSELDFRTQKLTT
ncbi:MAG: hypothetical protein DMG58_14405 [Acidobacteria bacterium]|nr:MAG: hypothetical protein DMG58_14405 [Acidobacteriota bacterium]